MSLFRYNFHVHVVAKTLCEIIAVHNVTKFNERGKAPFPLRLSPPMFLLKAKVLGVVD